jgi:hypothetical protein
MADLDPDVVAALQAAHNLEATNSERWHKQEHAFKQGKGRYPKLGRWFDRRHKEAYARQHDLRCTLMSMDQDVPTEIGDTSYTDDPGKAFADACESIDALAAAHQRINDVTREAAKNDDDDTNKAWYRAIREKFHGYAKDLRKTYRKGEHKQQQLEDLGLPLFLHRHS